MKRKFVLYIITWVILDLLYYFVIPGEHQQPWLIDVIMFAIIIFGEDDDKSKKEKEEEEK